MPAAPSKIIKVSISLRSIDVSQYLHNTTVMFVRNRQNYNPSKGWSVVSFCLQFDVDVGVAVSHLYAYDEEKRKSRTLLSLTTTRSSARYKQMHDMCALPFVAHKSMQSMSFMVVRCQFNNRIWHEDGLNCCHFLNELMKYEFIARLWSFCFHRRN